MDGVQWNGDSFLCAAEVDGDTPPYKAQALGLRDAQDEHVDEYVKHEQGARGEFMVSLLDLARPAKRKGL